MTNNLPAVDEENLEGNWRLRFLAGGTILGAVVGLATAYLMTKASEESRNGPPDVSVMDAVGVSLSVMGVIRAIAALGD